MQLFFVPHQSIYVKLIVMADKKQRLFEVMGKVNPDFKKKLNEDAPFHTDHLIQSAIRSGFISQEEYDADQQTFNMAAEETVDSFSDWSEGEGFGSSDMTFALKEFLENAGIKTDFVNNRLTRMQNEVANQQVATDINNVQRATQNSPAMQTANSRIDTPQEFEQGFTVWFSTTGFNPQKKPLSISQAQTMVRNAMQKLGYR
jgi:hypothetical protein